MSEKRFRITTLPKSNAVAFDEKQKKYYIGIDFENLLNEQQATVQSLKEENEQLRKYNGQLKERLEKINGGYGHLTHRNGLTANEWLIESQERELEKKNEQISDWIEQHSKDIAKICEQQATISTLKEENEQLKKRLEHYKEVEAMNGDGKNE